MMATALMLLLGAAAEPEPVRLVFVGDVMLADGPGDAIAHGEDPLAAFAPVLSRADLALANLECSISTRGTAVEKPWVFRADPRVLPVLAHSFGAVTLANNHSGDFGPDALLDTLTLLTDGGVAHFGAGRDLAEAHAPLVVEKRGVRVALLGYNEFFPRRFEATASAPGVAWSEDEQVLLDIRAAREKHHADVVIPFMHWGWELQGQPSARQQELAHRMIDAGADAVVGTHPHVTQPVVLYKGKPVAYSLGNFLFDGFSSEQTLTGTVLRLEVDRHGVVRWDTVVAHLDAKGFPHPDLVAPGACGGRGSSQVQQCVPVP